jgi:2'-5' RNA ligase
MGYAIEMFFDSASESRIRSLWDALAAPGAYPMTNGDSRPHISLAVANSVDVPAVRLLLEDFARGSMAFPLSMESLGFFLSKERVAFLAPKATPELLALHARFFEQFSAVASGIRQIYSPSTWVPHCTLATGILPQQIALAVDACQSLGLPFGCTVVEIGLVEFPIVKQLYLARFAN